MPKLALTDLIVKKSAPTEKVRKMADGQGLYLEIHPNGGKYWRYGFRDASGKAQRLSLGVYPETSLSDARKAHQTLREQHRKGVNLSLQRRQEKDGLTADARNTFESLARDWHADTLKKWTQQNAHEIMRRMETHVFPKIGALPLAQLTAPEVLRAVKAIEKQGTTETARRALQYVGQALRYGVQHGRAERDFTPDLKGALTPADERHHNRVSVAEIPKLLRDLRDASLYPVTQLAIDWLFLTACRTGEMRGAKWQEIDASKARWIVPAERMKMKTQHVVPLSKQALKTLDKMRALGLTSEPDEYIFPAMQRQAQMMSENTVGYAFNRAGYHGRQTPHGIRGLFSTCSNESAKWEFNDIEMALAHQTGSAVSRAYNSSQRLPERAKLLQWWADELEQMRDGAKVIEFPIKQA